MIARYMGRFSGCAETSDVFYFKVLGCPSVDQFVIDDVGGYSFNRNISDAVADGEVYIVFPEIFDITAVVGWD